MWSCINMCNNGWYIIPVLSWTWCILWITSVFKGLDGSVDGSVAVGWLSLCWQILIISRPAMKINIRWREWNTVLHCRVYEMWLLQTAGCNKFSIGRTDKEVSRNRHFTQLRSDFCMASSSFILMTLKADSHIACRAHAVPLPCRAAKGV